MIQDKVLQCHLIVQHECSVGAFGPCQVITAGAGSKKDTSNRSVQGGLAS